jgi:PAS domain S-box-containing protein
MKSVLIIEDNGQGMEEVRTLLRERGCTVTECGPESADALLFNHFAVDRACVQVFWQTRDHRIIYANDSACRALGYTREELTRMSVNDIDPYYPGPEFSEFSEYWRTSRATGHIRFETYHRAKDGLMYPVEIQCNYIELEGREYCCSFVTDISERKRTEEKLLLQQFSIENAETIFLQFSGDGKILMVNEAACRRLGYTRDELLALSDADIAPVTTSEKRLESLRTLDAGGAMTVETVFRRKDGTTFPVEFTVNKLYFRGKSYLVVFGRDITERKRTEQVLQKTQKLKSLGILAGGIAHDFNDLLATIFGYFEMARVTCEAASKTADYLDKALETFTRAKDLTQQLLTFATGGAPFRKTGSIAPIIKERTQCVLSGSRVSCSFHSDDRLWLCDFDENQMGQVVGNIVMNAVQAMPLGGKLIVAVSNVDVEHGHISFLKQGRYVHVFFTDTGSGIPPSDMPHIFDPFFTTRDKGYGLGLAMVHSIIKRHDGEIAVESEPGRGTTLHLYLPASGIDAVTQTAMKAGSHEGTGRILIMDDDASIREILGEMLRMMGYDAEYACNGHDALRMIREAGEANTPFQGAVMDLTIPGGMGGREAVGSLREGNNDMIVFASSGYSEDPVMADPAAYGFTDKIQKPFKIADLESLFARHM